MGVETNHISILKSAGSEPRMLGNWLLFGVGRRVNRSHVDNPIKTIRILLVFLLSVLNGV